MNRAGHSRGFTIVELLIVIVVIGILAAITVVAFTGVQSRARDAQRSSDLANIQKALELFRAEKGAYPACGNEGNNGVFVAGSGNTSVCGVSGLTSLVSGKYLPAGVADPRNTGAYVYWYAVGFRKTGHGSCAADNSMNYILGARFEGSGNGVDYNCWSNVLNWHGGTNS